MIKIMIVDDEALERRALKIMLDNLEWGEVIAECKNGKEAIEFDKKYDPDLIIMDIKMPGLDGCKVAEIIKSNNNSKIIIMLTAHDDFNLVRKSLVLGVNDYILKPVRPKELLKVLEKLIVNLKINNKNEYKKEVRKNIVESISPIDNAIEYINNNLGENISLELIASKCNLSPCYFSKLFKKEVGVNLSNYISNKKIEKAKEILRNTDTPILNIAFDLGFEDCGYFIRVFKKLEGVTPKKYREMNLK